jgi:hypothetical protein
MQLGPHAMGAAAPAKIPARGEAMPANGGWWKLQGGLEEVLEASTGDERERQVDLGSGYGGAAEWLGEAAAACATRGGRRAAFIGCVPSCQSKKEGGRGRPGWGRAWRRRRAVRAGTGGERVDARHMQCARAPRGLGVRVTSGRSASRRGSAGAQTPKGARHHAAQCSRAGAPGVLAGATSPAPTHLPLFDHY